MANLLQGIGQAQPVSQFVDTLGRYQVTQAQLETQRLHQQMLQAQARQAQEQEAHMNQVTNFKLSPFYLSLPDEAKPVAEKAFQGAGVVDANFFGKRRDMYAMADEIQKTKPLFEQIMKPVVEAKNQAAIKAYEKWQKAPGDKQLEADYNIARAEAERAGGKYWEHIDKMQENAAKQKDEPLEKVETPTGPTLVPRSQAAGMTPYEKPPEDKSELIEIRRNQQEETARHNKAIERLTAEKAKSGGQDLGFADKEAIRAMGKQLPKSKAAAETAVKNVQKIDRMIALVNQGAGGVKGELLAKINKVADALRVTPPEDAKYNTLKAELRGFAGQIRLQLGVVGQTSDRDIAIMYEAAGGNSPAESQKAILAGYKQAYQQDIDNYNSDAKAYSEYSKAGATLYKPIGVNSGPSVVERRTLKNGETWEKLSDGTFRKAQ